MKPIVITLYLEVAYDSAALDMDAIKETVESARSYGTIQRAEVVIPAETKIDLR